MRAKRCAHCGQPQVFVRQCLVCGSTETDFWEGAENQELAEMVRGRRFENALNMANQQIQFHPDEAEGYFLRLLARRKCAVTEELLWKGFSPEEGTDLHAAMLLSEGETHEALAWTETWMRNISQVLLLEEDKHLVAFRDGLHLLEEKQRLSTSGETERTNLYNLYMQVENAEGEIHRAEEKCRAALSQAMQRLLEAKKKADSFYTDAQQVTSMEKSTYDSWKAHISNIRKAAIEAKADYDAAKACYAQEILEPSRKREVLLKRIDHCLKNWNNEGGNARNMLRVLKQEIVQVNARKNEIQAGLFSIAAKHLGKEAFLHALKETGLKALPGSGTVT